ncbi:MAG: hypothetical protein J6N20_04090 [Pseudomonas sp.]|nr:hypothetical protein [Pseudomonas sp.]
MSLNPFASTVNTTNEQIESDSDRLGGSFVWDGGAYTVTILAAYAGKSKGGAGSMNFEVQGEDGRKFKFTEWVTSGDAKGNKPYYEKDGKKSYLPGFNNVNAIALFTVKKELNALTFENKILKLRDYEQKKDVPTEVPMAVELIGKQFILGLEKHEVNKTIKVGNDYKPVHKAGEPGVPETKFENQIGKIFFVDNKATIAELREAKQKGVAVEAAFYPKWVEANTGKVVNKVKTDNLVAPAGAGGPAGTPTTAGGEQVDSLFD